MQELLKDVVPALLALTGALVAAILAHRRWGKEPQRSAESAYEDAKRAAYKTLWDRLEEVNLALREDSGNNSSLFESLKQINTLFIRNSVYLDEADHALVVRYVEALHRWRSAVYTSGDEDVVSAFAKTWPGIPANLDTEIGQANRNAAELRATLLDRVRKHLQQ